MCQCLNVTRWILLIDQNSCDSVVILSHALSSINHINREIAIEMLCARWNIENECMSICQIKKSKRITRYPVEVLKLGLNPFDCLAEGKQPQQLRVVVALLFFFIVLLLLKMSSADRNALSAKSLHRLPCNIYVFSIITEEH